MNPAWSKGYARKGAALHGLKRYDDAIAAYEAGIKYEDSPALRKGLQEVQEAKCTLCPGTCDLRAHFYFYFASVVRGRYGPGQDVL